MSELGEEEIESKVSWHEEAASVLQNLVPRVPSDDQELPSTGDRFVSIWNVENCLNGPSKKNNRAWCCFGILFILALFGSILASLWPKGNSDPESCPPLRGHKLVPTQEPSYTGDSVNLECDEGYIPFPSQVVCQEQLTFDGLRVLEWSAPPVCVPKEPTIPDPKGEGHLVSTVNCTSTPGKTECKLYCQRGYVATEEQKYSCTEMPCVAWEVTEKACLMCDQYCSILKNINDARPADVLDILSCDRDLTKVLVSSNDKAALYQSSAMGVYTFIGEYQGRPVFKNDASGEFLHYSPKGNNWRIGRSYYVPHAGIEIGISSSCPNMEEHGPEDIIKQYRDDDQNLQNDSTISIQPFQPEDMVKMHCPCNEYRISWKPMGKRAGSDHDLDFFGTYRKDVEKSWGLQAPLYVNEERGTYLFSYHPWGKTWLISTNTTTFSPPLARAEFPVVPSCPGDKQFDNVSVTWEWYKKTLRNGTNIYISDDTIQVECISS